MESKELRLGNNVLYNGIFATVKNINYSTVRLYIDNELEDILINIEDIEPIPLNEEWLIKFGFKKSTIEPIDCDYSKKYDISSNVFLNGYTVFQNDFVNVGIKETELQIIQIENYLDESQGFESIGKSLKYVHKLQNIYFALTDEDLKPNE